MSDRISQWNIFFINPKYKVYRYGGLILLLFTIIFLLHFADYGTSINLASCIGISLLFLLFYLILILINSKILIPKLLLNNRNIFYICCFVGIIILVSFIQEVSTYRIEEAYNIKHQSFDSTSEYVLYITVVFFINAFFFAGISITLLLQRRFIDYQEIDKLEKECLFSELQELKKKIQPDFLFNMLNKASVLAIKEPHTASEILFKLSHILRYQLYDSEREKVLLTADMAFINDYLTLEKIRSGNFDFTITKQGKMNGILIPALLFIPVINEAIRFFCLNEQADNCPYMHIRYIYKEQQLTFVCIVSKLKKGTTFNIKSHHLYRRIELLYGATCYLGTEENAHEYTVNLKIPL